MKKYIPASIKVILVFLLVNAHIGTLSAQSNNWTKDEAEYYKKMKSLCEYIQNERYDTARRGLIFKEFIYFDNVLSDTSIVHIRERTQWFDGLFIMLIRFVDSVGLSNLDAVPTRFFKADTTFFEPYGSGGDLEDCTPYTLTYFDKRHPEHPIGTLLFEVGTHKLLSWIVLNQGGYRYFLTFNLM
ncbi:MAG: hypothetical protein QM768_03715 [Agriterribacter sp.]